jgi:fermentation-respiration switch protein FrsA (DUF1100 family)
MDNQKVSERAQSSVGAQLNGRKGVRLITSIVTIVFAVALVWIVMTTAWMWRYQERVVFQPPGANPDAPAPARRVEYAAADGHALFGYVVSPPGAQRAPQADVGQTVVIAFHGNADLAAWQVPWAQEVVERTGATVLVPEYRGYAGIAGSPSYQSAAADALGALAFARSELGATNIVLHGHSLGSAIASELAAQMNPPPAALVLVSPFTSARDMATRMLVPPIPGLWGRISRVHYDTRGIVARLDSPVFVAHGDRDLNIPVRMGQRVFAAARRPAELLIVEGAGHNDVPDLGAERYWRWLTAAIAGSVAGAPGTKTNRH